MELVFDIAHYLVALFNEVVLNTTNATYVGCTNPETYGVGIALGQ